MGFAASRPIFFSSTGPIGRALQLRREAGTTLEALYLDPLLARVRINGGRVYRDGPPFTLLIDIKTNGREAYKVLAEKLAGYAEMLTVVRDGRLHPGAVTVVISGDRARTRLPPTRFATRASTAAWAISIPTCQRT